MAKNKFSTGRGKHKADVANSAVRNVLTEISSKLLNTVTHDYLVEAAAFFGYKCPYTGKDIKNDILTCNMSNLELDHIVPENRYQYGLNIQGNTILVDKYANSQKKGLSVEDFLLNHKMFAHEPLQVRQDRLDKIKMFQAKYNYDQTKLNAVIGTSLQEFYDEVAKRQEEFYMDLIKKINRKCFKINHDLSGYVTYLNSVVKPNSVNRYASALKTVIVEETIKVKDLDNKNYLIKLIQQYNKGGIKYNPNDKGNIVAALKKYAEYKKINLTVKKSKSNKITGRIELDFKNYLKKSLSNKATANKYYKRLNECLVKENLKIEDLYDEIILTRLINEHKKGGIKYDLKDNGFTVASLNKFKLFKQ